MRKNFYAQDRNSFVCRNCGQKNNDDQASPRNHCRFCLTSLHLDQTVPGDRLSDCHGLLKPVAIEYNRKKGYIIVQACLRCNHKTRNKAADDDNFDLITTLSNPDGFPPADSKHVKKTPQAK